MKVQYSSIGKTISIQVNISDLSGREKCELFNHLMEDLGIMRAMDTTPDSCESFQRIWATAMAKHWER